MRQLHKLSRKIMKQYPPDRYHYIGLGRSPSAIMAFLQVMAPGTGSNVPLSEFRYNVKGPDPRNIDRTLVYPPLPKAYEAKLFHHFDLFLPPLESLQGKTLLIIDFISTGTTMDSAQHYLTKYLQERNYPQLRLKALGLAYSINYFARLLQNKFDLDILDIDSDFAKVSSKMVIGKSYDQLAQYPKFNVLSDQSENLKMRGEYAQLLNEVQDYLDDRAVNGRWQAWPKAENCTLQ